MNNFLKKFVSIGAVVLCIVPVSSAIAACSGGEQDYYTVSFESNGGSAVASQSVEKGATATEPEDPVREGYDFTVWYSDSSLSSEYVFSTAVTSDITLYAGWEESETLYTVTFDYNYGDLTPTEVTVSEGDTVARPDNPGRDGYTFMGWYADADGTGAPYDFSAAVAADTTLYAAWYEVQSGYCIATFWLNDGSGDFYIKTPFRSGAFYQDIADEVSDPALNGRHFTGWYKNADATAQYNALNSFTSDVDIYADWQYVYVLEAEHTNLDGKVGSGYSGSTSGTGMIEEDTTDSLSASNGYYVSWLYYNGAYLTFELVADEAVDDVTIIFRLSARYNDVNVTGDQIYVGVNHDGVSEGKDAYEAVYNFSMTIQSYSEMSSNIKDFQNYTVAYNVSLNKGTNTIELVINNSIAGVGGTMKAAAPLVDCMYLYTDAIVTPVVYNQSYTKNS